MNIITEFNDLNNRYAGSNSSGQGARKFGKIRPWAYGISFDANLNPRGRTLESYFTNWSTMASASGAPTGNPYYLAGSGTPAQSKGGTGRESWLKLSTSAASTNRSIVSLVTTSPSGGACKLVASKGHRFDTVVSLPAITSLLVSCGLDEVITEVIPGGTGDCALLLFDPGDAASSGLSDHGNWKIVTRVNGTKAFLDSGVAVAADTNYWLSVEINEALEQVFSINGTVVATVTTPLTAGDSVYPLVGVQTSAAAAKSVETQFIDYMAGYLLE